MNRILDPMVAFALAGLVTLFIGIVPAMARGMRLTRGPISSRTLLGIAAWCAAVGGFIFIGVTCASELEGL